MSETHPDSPVNELPVDETSSVATPDTGDVAATPATPADTEAEGDAARPSERIRIGTQREGSEEEMPVAKATALPPAIEPSDKPASRPEAPKVTGKIYPPPNIRDRLSADLEAEFEAALAGESLDDLMESKATSGNEIPEGTSITGRVAKVYQDNIFVDLGGRHQGVMAMKQFEDRELPEVGSEVAVVVARAGEDGLYELTLPGGAIEVGNWEDVQEGQVVEVTVTGANKGGLECQVAGLRGFMPMGQISIYRVEHPEDYVGQRLNAVVTEANRDRRNLVLSHRGVMEREKAANRDKLMTELAVGQLREGVVRSLRDFGAFVDLGGVDGLIHVSKMSWDRVNHPSEVLQEGQTVKVKIDRIDPDTGKIGLSYRESAENPWDKVESKYYTGATVKGTVSKTMDFGAFVKLEPGVEGLIHISELAHGRVFRTTDVVQEGQGVEVKVLSIDKEKQRIGLSLRALTEAPKKAGEKEVEDTDFTPPPDAPKAPAKRQGNLKGGIGGPSGGEKFGLKW